MPIILLAAKVPAYIPPCNTLANIHVAEDVDNPNANPIIGVAIEK
jgi:hypothetical protein